MRAECQARIIAFGTGETFACLHPQLTEVVGLDYIICGKPAVETLESVKISMDASLPILERIQRMSVPLCAEHWDRHQKDMQELDDEAPEP